MRLDSSQSIQPQIRSIDGLSIRYAESEPREDHALLLSPWPESIYCYEPTWSRSAEHAQPVNAEYLHERLPKSKLDLIDALHFIWEDAADAYAALVTSWWDGGYAKAGLRQ
jgi:hypothetical protein